MTDEGLVEHRSGLVLGPETTSALDATSVPLVRMAAMVALGSPAVCLE
jgi:hypothetical protein